MSNRLHSWVLYFFLVIMFVASGYLFIMPDKWDHAKAIKVCDGLPIVQLEDGTMWLRYHWRYYQVENAEKICR